MISPDSSTSSVRPSKNSKSRRKTTRWSSMSVISSAHSWSSVMRSWRSCTRRSRFRNLHLRKVRFITKTKSTLSFAMLIKLSRSNVSLLMLRLRLSAFLILRERSICWRRNCLNNSWRRSSCKTSWRNLWMSTGGGSLKALILTHMNLFRKFSRCRNDLSLKLRKLQRKMCLFKKKRSFTSSWRTSSLNSLVPK